MAWIWLFAFIAINFILAYHYASARVWALSIFVFLALWTGLHNPSDLAVMSSWALFFIIFSPLLITSWRHTLLSKPILKLYRRTMPSMSKTEREALAAGTVSFEGELFKGNPNWDQFMQIPKPHLSPEEQAFLNGPVEILCKLIDDWDITHNRGDIPPELWQFMKDEGFFSLIIPKQYGGKEFSAYAHSQILTKIYGRSTTVATTVAVPNSLGPAELLLHYGTEEQKNYYLPRLAKGIEMPCFALTGPDAGSDAGAMTDTGIICMGDYEGQKTLGIRLNFNKRYITLAPVATVIGLAFKLYDPEHLLGKREDLGITCALIPRTTPGLIIGRRHFPANVVFQNGPVKGKDVFIPLDWIIGGPRMAGQGWRMLMECLAAGRAISLPASAIGGAKIVAYSSGAYARVRKQFNVPIGRFEGIEEVLARIAGKTYMMDATRIFTATLIDQGAKPSVASAITKYHVTELGRLVANDGMDIHAGKGLTLGPSNYLMRFYESIPIAITVEGANILTRSMIIFGQGAMRCHPFVFAEYEAVHQEDEKIVLRDFDTALMGHANFIFCNFLRSFMLGFTGGRGVHTPDRKLKRYFQQITRFSTAFALLADVSILTFGGSLKRKENFSARLGDILSYLFILSATIKHYYDQGKHTEDLPIVHWACQQSLYVIQQTFDEILNNFPHKILSSLLRFVIFPWGKHFRKPSDKLNHKVSQLLLSPTAARARLTDGAFVTNTKENIMSLIDDALLKSIAAEPIEKIIKSAAHDKILRGVGIIEQAEAAFALQLISQEQLDVVLAAETARRKVLAVDDFAPEELARINVKSSNHDIYATIQPTS